MNQHTSPPIPSGDGGRHWVDQFLPQHGLARPRESGPLSASFLRGVVYRQRFLIAATIGVVMLAGLIVTLLMTPVYEATATVRIDPYASNIVEGQDAISHRLSAAQPGYAGPCGLRIRASLSTRLSRGGAPMRTIAWLFALGFIGAVTVFAQVDRQSRISPEVARYVPEVFASFAQRHSTAQDLLDRNPETATEVARSLVANRPMPAENLRMYAQARALAGDEQQAVAAIVQAAQRGWRDEPTQRAMLEIALEAGDRREAARRLAAWWALSRDRALLEPLANRVLVQEDARAEMARLLAEEPRWKASFDRLAPDLLDPAILRDIEERRKGPES
ncbi:Chain length determinant protein [Altererythrobacter xiamenensis]|uniref:Chain length determinant protein n=1 Tax=Altererythrobacter xiamenensis TaxID=1316679 RepID=A0A1Y6F3M5_9SPHN|nr:Wzz/FepE/Etk N-terminal domain-containing protein [Altererythrobacter xiamenensis]SMQ69455.1 Chain length determinant protein [Altererythrobacter xiamenensis]